MKTNPSEKSSPRSILHLDKSISSSAGIEVLQRMQPEEDLREPVLENGFHTSQACDYDMG